MINNIKARKILIWIANVSLIAMFVIGFLRINYRFMNIPYIYNISDLLWVYALTIFLMTLPIKSKKIKFLVITIPYLLVMVDEILQKSTSFYLHPNIPIVSLFISGTFDVLDLLAYTLGYLLALITSILVFKFVKSK